VNHAVPALAVALSLLTGLACAQGASKTPDVADTSFVTADGARTLQQSVVIHAPVAVLWTAFTDAAQFERWSAPAATIDFRVGGRIESSYDPARKPGDPDNIVNRIVTFLPQRLIVLQNIQAPHGLAHADLFQKTVTVVEFEPLAAAATKVTFSSTGWAADPLSAPLYAFFQAGDAEELEKMKTVYEAH
jgi:uncharacterized protein YndB with AHSA1/START domain